MSIEEYELDWRLQALSAELEQGAEVL